MAGVEEKLGKEDRDVIFRKKFYTLILLEHLELVNTINKECGEEINVILFFYSNEEEDVGTSEDIGEMLGILYRQNKDKLFIYSIDVNLDSKLVTSLRQKYDVTAPMKIIINDEHAFTGLQNINQIQKLLN